ncbi:MAG TPA: tRNA (adenosine(37)-N6)-dimethylallyltransferase MiaA [Gemmatimonadaceae bacterium]|nr:tRNA (adenosine(37)-N6)-dimethylallyltransferase MiaA [Gemmatimonadaceae bacterium]
MAVLCGPTAAGKSALALALAERHGLAIISADSRQVYRGFDVGTAKSSPEERSRLTHYGLDVADPVERYSAARWVEGARQWIADAEATGRTPLVVGGTGFYLRALAEPLFVEPPLDPVRRADLATELAALPLPALRERVRALDPSRAHLGRAQLLRAIEVSTLTGRPISEWHRERGGGEGHTLRYLIVDPGREELRARIAERADAMFRAGWADEVRALMELVPADAPAWNATGYDVVRELVSGRLAPDVARERVVVATRQYAKRQRTWFRHQLAGADVTLLDPRAADADALVERWWTEILER